MRREMLGLSLAAALEQLAREGVILVGDAERVETIPLPSIDLIEPEPKENRQERVARLRRSRW